MYHLKELMTSFMSAMSKGQTQNKLDAFIGRCLHLKNLHENLSSLQEMKSCIAITYNMQEKNNEQENMKIEINGEYIHGCANECCLSFMSCVVVCLNW